MVGYGVSLDSRDSVKEIQQKYDRGYLFFKVQAVAWQLGWRQCHCSWATGGVMAGGRCYGNLARGGVTADWLGAVQGPLDGGDWDGIWNQLSKLGDLMAAQR